MEQFSLQKNFTSNLLKFTEDNFDISPCKKEKSKSYQHDEASPFSFSFNNFEPNELRKTKEPRKIQFGLNLLTSYQKTFLKHAFKLIKAYEYTISPVQKLLLIIMSKRKRASFIK